MLKRVTLCRVCLKNRKSYPAKGLLFKNVGSDPLVRSDIYLIQEAWF